MNNNLFFVIRIRGTFNIPRPVQEVFKALNLNTKFAGRFIPDNLSVRGMLKKIKDYAAWGNLSPEVGRRLLWKRGMFSNTVTLREVYPSFDYSTAMELTYRGNFLKNYFRLTPPLKGFSHGIRNPAKSRHLGFLGNNINNLVERMS